MENYLNDPVLAWLRDGAKPTDITPELTKAMKPITNLYPNTRGVRTLVLYVLHTFGAKRNKELTALLGGGTPSRQRGGACTTLVRQGLIEHVREDTHMVWRLTAGK